MPSPAAIAPVAESRSLSADLRNRLDAQIEDVLINGDLRNLAPPQRVAYYHGLCQSLGLNPLTRPFDYITLSGRLTLYAKKDATDQLRTLHGVSITQMDATARPVNNQTLYVVTAHATDRTGRTDVSTGVVALNARMSADDLANAMMKAETKAKRRVTLSICGLGMLDESEMATVRGVAVTSSGEVARATVNVETGEILSDEAEPAAPQAAPRPEPSDVHTQAEPQHVTRARARRDGPSNMELSEQDGLTRVTHFRVAGRGTNSRGPWTRYVITLSDGREASTFNQSHATIAREAGEQGTPVEAVTASSRDGRGIDLQSIEPYFAAAVDPVDNDDDIMMDE